MFFGGITAHCECILAFVTQEIRLQKRHVTVYFSLATLGFFPRYVCNHRLFLVSAGLMGSPARQHPSTNSGV